MIIWGDAITEMNKFQGNTIDTIFTSPNPPFFLEQINHSVVGGEESTVEYLNHLIAIFNSSRRVLKDTGSLYVHMGDIHDHETGNLMLIPEQFVTNMVKFGWVIRDNIIWHRTERIHESSYDKTRHRRDAERVFRFVKNPNIAYFDTRGHSYYRSSVQSFPYDPRKGSGFPFELVDMAIKESCPRNGIILDPMAGSGTTGEVAKINNRPYILIDIMKEMADMMRKRLQFKDS